MGDTTDFVSRIKVRDLISAYENKSNSAGAEFFRPRAKSVGNVLAKNVIVQLSEFNNLDDLEKALRKIETNLNFYGVYNKEKHVAFQEQLFNILTSIVNVESDADDATARRKRLISKTQTLVSFLNQKLPSNVNTVVSPEPSPYKYTPYSAYVKENGAVDTKPNNIIGNAKQKQAPHSGSTKIVDITDPSGEHFVSVRKLKEHFLPKSESVPEAPPKADTKFKTEYTFKIADPVVSNGFQQEQLKEERAKKEQTKSDQPQEEQLLQGEKSLGILSVSKLRNLFEQKSEESSKGLEMITDQSDDKGDLTKSMFGGSASNLNFPYTERNLGNFRLQRSVSGNYMNYAGLLKRVDISRTNSVNDLNKVDRDSDKSSDRVEDSYVVESGTESDVEDEVPKNAEEVKVNYSTASLDNVGREAEGITTRSEEEREFENAKVFEVKYSLATQGSEEPRLDNNDVDNEDIKKVQHVQEIEVKYSATTPDDAQEESSHTVRERVATIENVEEVVLNYSTAETKNTSENQDIAVVKGIEESDVKYSTATSDDINQDINTADKENILNVDETEVNQLAGQATNISKIANVKEVTEQDSNDTNKASFASVEETEINYSTAESKNISGSETTADITGIKEVDVQYSTAVSDNIKENSGTIDKENIDVIDGVEERDVKYLTVESKDGLENEETTIVNGIEVVDVNYSTAICDLDAVKRVAVKSHSEDDLQNPSTNGTSDLQFNYREATTIDEEIDKIEVDQTLANEDLALNAEDLKNADDEFEKLLESSETGKITT